MQVHFYTSLANLNHIESGRVVAVWNKSEATEGDVHISITAKEYNIRPTPSKTKFNISKRRKYSNSGFDVIPT